MNSEGYNKKLTDTFFKDYKDVIDKSKNHYTHHPYLYPNDFWYAPVGFGGSKLKDIPEIMKEKY